jgi:hypothetical protein
MTENEFTSKAMLHPSLGTGAYEFKLTKGLSVPFDVVVPHQLNSLFKAKKGRLAVKIRDVGIFKKPFDVFILERVPAYVALVFWKRGCRHFYLVDIDVWFKESQESVRRSITEARAAEIGVKYTL